MKQKKISRFLHPGTHGKQKDTDEVTEAEILTMVNEGNEKGAILPSEAELVHNVFTLDDKTVKDIMVHRNDIEAIDGNETLREAIDRFIALPYSRLPVFLDSLDNIIGVIHIKDILPYAVSPERYQEHVRDLDHLIGPAETVPETHGIYTLLTTMQIEKKHMAVVVDEYGQTSGIVSMEDIIEEIVGNIQDEHDRDQPTIREMDDRSYEMPGSTPLSEVSETLGTDFELNDIETLNGFLMNCIGRVPEDGETFHVKAKGYDFFVESVRDRMIQKVRVTPVRSQSSGQSGQKTASS